MRVTDDVLKEYKRLQKQKAKIEARIDEIKEAIFAQAEKKGHDLFNTKTFLVEIVHRPRFAMASVDECVKVFGLTTLKKKKLIKEINQRFVNVEKLDEKKAA